MSSKDVSAVMIGMNILYETEEQLRAPLRKLKLRINEWLVLKTIYLGYANTPSDIANYLSMQRASVTRHVDNLCKQKMLDRIYSKEDRRTVELKVTNSGISVCKKILSIYPNITSNIYQRLDNGERNLWLSMMNSKRVS